MTSRPRARVMWPDGVSEGDLDLAPTGKAGTLAEQIAAAGRSLNTRCALHGLCAGCTVQLVAGRFLQRDGSMISAPAEIKACQGNLVPLTDTVIRVPTSSLVVHQPQVVTSFKTRVDAANAPIVPVMPGVRDHGFAIDIGTTTVVVALVDLASGRIVGEESGFNRQIELGDDVLTRIQIANSPVSREALRQAIVGRTLLPLARTVCARAEVSPERVAAMTVAGNTTMLHLLTGIDPTAMGVAPFRAAFTEHRVLTAGEIGLDIARADTPVHLLPGFSAYVGADLVAGCVCTGLLNGAGPNLLVDVGTNGEILLRHGDRLYATATAAGPAFEGGRLTRGTRAVAGAVAHVAFPERPFPPRLEFIPGATDVPGLCGSAYVDYLAQARRIQLLGTNGRFEPAMWAAVPEPHCHRNGHGRGVSLRAGDPATIVTEADVAHLLQAKAAIAAGILTLLRRAGLEPADVNSLYLAGGFGLHLDVSHAIACGLLPGFTVDQIEVVGNTALGGAWLALIDFTILPEMELACGAAEVVELNLEPGFEDTFIDQLSLP